jgi:ATP phosphoribosyltransferase
MNLNFEKMNGLLPVVIQDYENNEVLMVGFMNKEAWELTKRTGKVHYYSRKKKRLWLKGEESGHYQIVKEIYADNDDDSLLIKVNQIGGAVEDGYRSCFYKMKNGEKWIVSGRKVFNPKKVYKGYSDTVSFAVPSGSLYASTVMLFNLTKYQLELRGSQCLKPSIRNEKKIKLLVVRAKEIPNLIETGQVDMGLVGNDLVDEYGSNVTDIADLGYNESGKGEVLWVLAVPENKKSKYKKLEDFKNKKISTELPNTTKKFFVKKRIPVQIITSYGSTESHAPFLSDAILDLAETGKSLKDNGLIPLYKIKSSTVHLYANNHSLAYGWKRRKMEEVAKELKKACKKLPKNPKKVIKLP